MIDEAEYQRRYDVIAAAHLEHYRAHGTNPWMSEEPQLRAWTIGKIREWVPPSATVLDAGCGIGLMLGDLSGFFAAVGVDIAAEYIADAQARGCDARVGWLEHLPFDTGQFDAAVCCDVLEHVQDPERVVSELRRVVKPGGTLVVRVPDGDATDVGADSGFGFPVHLRSWDATTLPGLVGGTVLGWESWRNELVLGAAAA